MKRTPLVTLILSAIIVSSSWAQAIYTSIYPGAYDGFTSTGNAPFTSGQTFTGFTGIQSVTYYIDETSGSPASRTFSAYLSEWDTSARHAVAGTFSLLGSTTITPTAYQQNAPLQFDFSSVALTASKTYMVYLSYGSGGTTSYINIINYGPVPNPADPWGPYITNPNTPDTFFASGAGYAYLSGSGYATVSAIESAFSVGSYNPTGTYYDMRMTVQASTASAVPEPSTYAAIFGALALGFVGWRRRVRR